MGGCPPSGTTPNLAREGLYHSQDFIETSLFGTWLTGRPVAGSAFTRAWLSAGTGRTRVYAGFVLDRGGRPNMKARRVRVGSRPEPARGFGFMLRSGDGVTRQNPDRRRRSEREGGALRDPPRGGVHHRDGRRRVQGARQARRVRARRGPHRS